MTRTCLALALLCAVALAALPLWADTISISGTKVTIREGDSPVVAVIEMSNDLSNGYGDERPVALHLPHLTVSAMFEYGEGQQADALIITPPDGTYCEPRSCVLRVEEEDSGVLRLMEWVGG